MKLHKYIFKHIDVIYWIDGLLVIKWSKLRIYTDLGWVNLHPSSSSQHSLLASINLGSWSKFKLRFLRSTSLWVPQFGFWRLERASLGGYWVGVGGRGGLFWEPGNLNGPIKQQTMTCWAVNHNQRCLWVLCALGIKPAESFRVSEVRQRPRKTLLCRVRAGNREQIRVPWSCLQETTKNEERQWEIELQGEEAALVAFCN